MQNFDSHVSVTAFTNLGGSLNNAIEETRSGAKKVVSQSTLPRRIAGGNDWVIPLYVGYTRSK